MRKQVRLFGCSDLPLFSGTPVEGPAEVFAPQAIPDVEQEPMKFTVSYGSTKIGSFTVPAAPQEDEPQIIGRKDGLPQLRILEALT